MNTDTDFDLPSVKFFPLFQHGFVRGLDFILPAQNEQDKTFGFLRADLGFSVGLGCFKAGFKTLDEAINCARAEAEEEALSISEDDDDLL